MIDFFELFSITTHFVFMLSLWLYLAVNLQWYSYKVERVLFYHHKRSWHLVYFVLPVAVYFVSHEFFLGFLYLIYLPSLMMWYRKLDKKLVFTGRVWRFFGIYFGFIFLDNLLCFYTQACQYNSIFIPIVFSIFISSIVEKSLLNRYASVAKEKILGLKDLKVIAITASFGKTSIKNFLYELLNTTYKTYKTPRSVNTYAGLIKDINENLKDDAAYYIAEAGARGKGDILEIAELIAPQYAVIGKIGAAHIEYFKKLENIKATKFELLKSRRLIRAFVYKENETELKSEIVKTPNEIRAIDATLGGTSFELKIGDAFERFETKVLGRFNVDNIAMCIEIALFLGVSLDKIKAAVKNLTPVEHRLQKLEANGKIILDDSFNGNLEGMLEAVRLSNLHDGRKVIVTPGLVESDKESNEKLGTAINEVFDIAIITGELNTKILSSEITKPQKIILKDKSSMQNILASYTRSGDLILFANDAPSFI